MNVHWQFSDDENATVARVPMKDGEVDYGEIVASVYYDEEFDVAHPTWVYEVRTETPVTGQLIAPTYLISEACASPKDGYRLAEEFVRHVLGEDYPEDATEEGR